MIDPKKMTEILKNMNLSKLARDLDIPYGVLNSWIKLGNDPRYSTVLKVSNYLSNLGMGVEDHI